MKILIILIFFISSQNLFASNDDDSIKYMLAYRFIVEDSKHIEKIFFEHINEKIEMCLSDNIVYIPKSIFLDEMIDYEYPCLNKGQKKNLHKELFKSDMLDSFSNYINPDLLDVGKTSKCNLKIFFSKIIENRLMATIIQANALDEYSAVFNKGFTVLFYLFYFDNNKIEMIMKKNVFR